MCHNINMDKSFTKQIDKNTYIAVDQGAKNGDYGCKTTIKIIDGEIYVQDIGYFQGEYK